MVSSTTTRALAGVAGVAVAALAAARVTRFFTTDTLAEWTIVGPAKLWAHRHESLEERVEAAYIEYSQGEPVSTPDSSNGWRSKLVSAFDCPYCVGQWAAAAGVVALAVYRAKRTPKILKGALALLGGALAMNYVTGNVNARLD